MQPTPDGDPRLDAFFAALPRARCPLLMLDYDGTLAPFKVERDSAAPYPGVREALNRIVAGRSRVVVVTGRAAHSLRPLLGLDHPVEVWGSHGAERLAPDGAYTPAALPPDAAAGLAEAADWLEEAGLAERCERKPTAVAVHWRGLDEAQAARLAALAEPAWAAIARRSRLELRPFDGGLELRAAGFDKGRAVNTLVEETGPGAAAAFLGDDLTDEHAFAALRGRGLTILVRPAYRQTAAELWLRPPGELLRFLGRWQAATSE
ncbi:MAG TPA: trehalose-phosphatase [Chloroflexaceae bacterium]|nr:trehalose-phosphatase [Chloroflexaceae bacterium]